MFLSAKKWTMINNPNNINKFYLNRVRDVNRHWVYVKILVIDEWKKDNHLKKNLYCEFDTACFVSSFVRCVWL